MQEIVFGSVVYLAGRLFAGRDCMAWIPFYADDEDFISIIERLNNDSEIAFIQPHRKYFNKKWIAQYKVKQLNHKECCLWHIPGGEIKRYVKGERIDFSGKLHRLFNKPQRMLVKSGSVADPWKGWRGPHILGEKNVPFLGGEPNIIQLVVNTTGTKNDNAIGLSYFGWIANRYKAAGIPADTTTVNWWNRLRRWVEKQSAAKIPRSGSLNGSQPEIWAFPSAYESIKSGKEREPDTM